MKAAAARRKRSATAANLGVKIVPFGPTPEEMQAFAGTVARHRAVQALLARTRHRLLRIDTVDRDEEVKPARPWPPSGFRAVFYDYTNNRTVLATGALAKPATLKVVESAAQPLPSEEEFAEAVRVVTTEPDGARFLLLAGRPFHEPIARAGPFVMNSEAEVRQAFADYQAGRF